jgi:hypothetical protein
LSEGVSSKSLIIYISEVKLSKMLLFWMLFSYGVFDYDGFFLFFLPWLPASIMYISYPALFYLFYEFD